GPGRHRRLTRTQRTNSSNPEPGVSVCVPGRIRPRLPRTVQAAQFINPTIKRRSDMTATMPAPAKAKRTPVPLHGVDTPTLLATINVVGGQPELAKYKFRARNRWASGTHSQSTIYGCYGAGSEQEHVLPFKADGDHPNVLCGADPGPTPDKWVPPAL